MNYDWLQYRNSAPADRYPAGSRGLAEWKRSIRGEGAPMALMEARAHAATEPTRRTVFVSHRQRDADLARRVAYIACQEGFDYWLDVLDPSLTSMSPSQSATLVAGIIEMALLNCTHVLAVITPQTNGSQWVPYEYGRVKEPVPVSPQAACWVEQSLAASDLPQYLYLGPVTRSESEIRLWLRGFGLGHATCEWSDSVPPRLP